MNGEKSRKQILQRLFRRSDAEKNSMRKARLGKMKSFSKVAGSLSAKRVNAERRTASI